MPECHLDVLYQYCAGCNSLNYWQH